MEQYTLGNGINRLIREREGEYKFGLMEVFMKVTGRMIKPMGEED